MGLASTTGRTEESMKDTGLMVNNTILASFETKMRLNAGCGKKESESSGLTSRRSNRSKEEILTIQNFTKRKIVFLFKMGLR